MDLEAAFVKQSLIPLCLILLLDLISFPLVSGDGCIIRLEITRLDLGIMRLEWKIWLFESTAIFSVSSARASANEGPPSLMSSHTNWWQGKVGEFSLQLRLSDQTHSEAILLKIEPWTFSIWLVLHFNKCMWGAGSREQLYGRILYLTEQVQLLNNL